MSSEHDRKVMLDALDAHINSQLRLKAVLEMMAKKLPTSLVGWADDAIERIDQAVAASRVLRDRIKRRAVAPDV